jgi:hypothetical protein
MDEITILNNQLSRMRSMNKYYHDQFLFDVRILFFFTIIFHYLALANNTAYMLIPFISLFGSVLLAFHAHYLIFSRNYSEFIGISSYVYSIVRLLNTDINSNYYIFIGLITLITLIIGIWWFLLGNGENRLEKVFDEYR